MSFAIIRGGNGRRHEVDFGDDLIQVAQNPVSHSSTISLVLSARDAAAALVKFVFARATPR